MPEPESQEKFEDQYDMDSVHSYEVGEAVPTAKDKVGFLLGIPFAGLTVGRFFVIHWNQDPSVNTRNYHGQFSVFLVAWNGIYIFFLSACLFTCFGTRPQMLAWRLPIIVVPPVFVWSVIWQAKFGVSQFCDAFHFPYDYDANNDLLAGAIIHLAMIALGYAVQPSNRYAGVGAWGAYCCRAWAKGRITRNYATAAGVGSIDYYLSTYLAALSRSGGAVAQIIPLVIFAFKRFKYILLLVFVLDDTPYKCYSILSVNFCFLLSFNAIVAAGMIGAVDISQIIMYCAVDCLNFSMRAIFLVRAGRSSCPKLFDFFLKKQLENFHSPLTRFSESVGDKVSMRCVQAFMCMMEGESLTCNLILYTWYFLQWWVVQRENIILFVCPMRNFLVIIFFLAIDFVQDMLAGKITKKFSTWSRIYCRERTAWHGKLQLPFALWVYANWSIGIQSYGGQIRQISSMLEQGRGQLPVYLVWHPPHCAAQHV